MDRGTIKIIYRDSQKMIFRVFPQGVRLKYVPGQYGALGLSVNSPDVDGSQNSNGHQVLVKRAYSMSSSILDDHHRLIDLSQVPYYEFYINLIPGDEKERPRLSARLFSLRDNDPIFISPKIVGHYTLESWQPGKNILFIGTMTGEAPHNTMINELLIKNINCQICHIVISEKEWVSAYAQNHKELMDRYPHYRYIGLSCDSGYGQIARMLRLWLMEPEISRVQLGWAIDTHNTHVYLCADPQMIGAPIKMGGWKYQYPQYGLMPILEHYQFKPRTRFQQGNISYEAYW